MVGENPAEAHPDAVLAMHGVLWHDASEHYRQRRPCDILCGGDAEVVGGSIGKMQR